MPWLIGYTLYIIVSVDRNGLDVPGNCIVVEHVLALGRCGVLSIDAQPALAGPLFTRILKAGGLPRKG